MNLSETIKACLKMDGDFYDNLAMELYGMCDEGTRRMAKIMAFGCLYGREQTPVGDESGPLKKHNSVTFDFKAMEVKLAQQLSSPSPWLMTEEQIRQQTPACLQTELNNVPWKAEDRMHRVGTHTYKVRVFSDSGMSDVTCGGQGLEDLDCEQHNDYTVVAVSELDARCLAFVLDGGCEPGLTDFDAGHVELALTYTKVL